MIRFIIAASFLVIFLIISIPIIGLVWLIGKFNPNLRDRISLKMVQFGFGTIARLSGVKVTEIGKEKIPEGAVLYIGNHRSYFDIVLLYTLADRLTGFVSKKSMTKFPVVNWWMRFVYCLFLDRDDPKQGLKTILTAVEYIKMGVSVCIFPEGTRNKREDLELLPFKEGSFKIATKSGCPIIPVALNNTSAIFEDHLPRLKKTHVIIEYCDPIYPNELAKEDKKHVGEICHKIIQDTINKNAALV